MKSPPSHPWMGRDTRQYPFMFPGREGYYERKVSRLHFKTLLRGWDGTSQSRLKCLIQTGVRNINKRVKNSPGEKTKSRKNSNKGSLL